MSAASKNNSGPTGCQVWCSQPRLFALGGAALVLFCFLLLAIFLNYYYYYYYYFKYCFSIEKAVYLFIKLDLACVHALVHKIFILRWSLVRLGRLLLNEGDRGVAERKRGFAFEWLWWIEVMYIFLQIGMAYLNEAFNLDPYRVVSILLILYLCVFFHLYWWLYLFKFEVSTLFRRNRICTWHASSTSMVSTIVIIIAYIAISCYWS
jgi:hypothetical protein